MIVYVDSSAVVKLITAELESSALSAYLRDADGPEDVVCSLALLETEVRRATWKHGHEQTKAVAAIERIGLLDITRPMYAQAGLLGDPSLRSLDALHIVGALEVAADVFVTYDARQASAARGAGLQVLSPGRG